MSESNGAASESPIQIHTQYLRDLSFENPTHLQNIMDSNATPSIEISLQTNANTLQNNTYEVIIEAEIRATHNGKDLFLIDLDYAAVVSLNPNLEEENIPLILMIHIPNLMFPFLRHIVATITTQGGMTPLLLNPVDFGALFLEQQKRNSEGA